MRKSYLILLFGSMLLTGCTEQEPEINEQAQAALQDDQEQALLLKAELIEHKRQTDLLVTDVKKEMEQEKQLLDEAEQRQVTQEQELLETAAKREAELQAQLNDDR